jgi:hypothetical protein
MAAFAALRPILNELPDHFPIFWLKRPGLRLGIDIALGNWPGERLKLQNARRPVTPASFLSEKNNFHGGSGGWPRLFQGGSG